MPVSGNDVLTRSGDDASIPKIAAVATVLAIAVWGGLSLAGFNNLPVFLTISLAAAMLWIERPELGASLTLLLSFLDFRTQLLGVNLRLYEIVALVLLSAWLLSSRGSARLTSQIKKLPIREFLWLWLFGLVSALWSISATKTLIHTLRLAVAVIFVALVVHSYREHVIFRKYVTKALAGGLLLVVAIGFIQMAVGPSFLELLRAGVYSPFISTEGVIRGHGSFFLGHHGNNLRPFAFFATPHIHAVAVGVVALFLLGIHKASSVRLIAIVGIAQLLVSDVYGALFALGFVLVVSIVASLWRVSGILTAILVAAGSAALIATFAAWFAFGTGVAGEAYFGRLQLWQIAWNSIRDNPLLGIGAGASPLLLRNYVQTLGYEFDHMHNWYLETAAEMGVAGLVLLIIFLTALFRRSYRGFKSNDLIDFRSLWIVSYFAGFNAVDSFVGGGNIAFLFFLLMVSLSMTRSRALPSRRNGTLKRPSLTAG